MTRTRSVFLVLVASSELAAKGIGFIDCGTSGGVWGLDNGYALMVGGTDESVAIAQPLFDALAPPSGKGYAHVGPVGSGHYTKMVHNGIEYGMMQAYAEGFAILHSSDLDIDAMAAGTVRIRLEVECDEWRLRRLRMHWERIIGVQSMVMPSSARPARASIQSSPLWIVAPIRASTSANATSPWIECRPTPVTRTGPPPMAPAARK